MGCVAEKTLEVSQLELKNKVYDCQCHEKPWEYEPHTSTDCKECHGYEIKSVHEAYVGETVDVLELDCSKCHETSLLKAHLPKLSCETCHGDIYKIHEKFEEEFIKR